MSDLHTSEDVTRERVNLMRWREYMEATEGGPGFQSWRVMAAVLESSITFRAVELGLERHEG
jgi:hypothetical protein